MISIHLDEAERLIMVEILHSTVMDLRMEIAHTDSYDFRQGLKGRKETVKKVLEAFEAAGDVRSAG